MDIMKEYVVLCAPSGYAWNTHKVLLMRAKNLSPVAWWVIARKTEEAIEPWWWDPLSSLLERGRIRSLDEVPPEWGLSMWGVPDGLRMEEGL